MKKLAFMFAALLCATPVFAQFGKLGDIANKAAKVKKIADVKVTDAEERQRNVISLAEAKIERFVNAHERRHSA